MANDLAHTPRNTTRTEYEELMAEIPAPELPTAEEIEAMYAEYLAREVTRAADGHKDHHYWVA